MRGVWVMAIAGHSACGEGTAPTPPIVGQGMLLGEFEGQRQYELSNVMLGPIPVQKVSDIGGFP